MKLRIYHLLFCCTLAGCISPPSYPPAPVITFASLSRSEVAQNDTVRIKIEYTDGDGDLGYDVQDTLCKQLCNLDTCLKGGRSLFLLDNRIPGCLADVYVIPSIPAKGSSDAISGTISFLSPRICCIKPPVGSQCQLNLTNPRDTVIFSLFLRDRAGNFSDTLKLPPIVIHCDQVVQ